MRLLIVEDERKLADTLKQGLADHGHAVDVAYDGEDGLAMACAAPYDLIVLDIMLPVLDGLTVCQRLRARAASMPILMLTARDAIDDRVAGLDTGADDYLTKPFAFRELLARIRALLRRDGPSRQPVLRFADIELNTLSRAVQRDGRPVDLTTKEYAILEYFAHHPNQLLSRAQIAEHVWDFDFSAMSNVIDVYVGNLRRKLGDEREPRLLRTVRGGGYQLRASVA